jgi:hypothetical protein
MLATKLFGLKASCSCAACSPCCNVCSIPVPALCSSPHGAELTEFARMCIGDDDGPADDEHCEFDLLARRNSQSL